MCVCASFAAFERSFDVPLSPNGAKIKYMLRAERATLRLLTDALCPTEMKLPPQRRAGERFDCDLHHEDGHNGVTVGKWVNERGPRHLGGDVLRLLSGSFWLFGQPDSHLRSQPKVALESSDRP